MKLRHGFVSNSSSSSFCVVTTKDNHEAALKQLPPFVTYVVDQLMFGHDNKLGMDLVYGGTYDSASGYGTVECIENCLDFDGDIPKTNGGEWEDYSEDGEMSVYEAWNLYLTTLGDNVLTFDVTDGG